MNSESTTNSKRWNIEEVGKWLQLINLPQYISMFRNLNKI